MSYELCLPELPESVGPAKRFVPGGWTLRDETEPEASSPCLGPRDAAKPVSGLRGRSPKIMRPTRGKASFRCLGTREEGVEKGLM